MVLLGTVTTRMFGLEFEGQRMQGISTRTINITLLFSHRKTCVSFDATELLKHAGFTLISETVLEALLFMVVMWSHSVRRV